MSESIKIHKSGPEISSVKPEKPALTIANEKIEELSKKLIIAGAQMLGLSEVNEDLIKDYRLLCQDLDHFKEIERLWETTMMDAIGEDGPGCVSDAIKSLKAENESLKKEMSCMYY